MILAIFVSEPIWCFFLGQKDVEDDVRTTFCLVIVVCNGVVLLLGQQVALLACKSAGNVKLNDPGLVLCALVDYGGPS